MAGTSSTNKDNLGDDGVEVDVDDGAMTLNEALEEYEELEKVSTAVLGGSDPQNCSYSKGYVKRQALYACLTCNPKNAPHFQEGGVCLACTYKCHEGHEMVELYTKRNFRCDCGNKKFPDNPCTLQKEKDEFNEKNTYSQNFAGLYCTCHRPYPDPDESAETAAGAMIQCVICEDWHHIEHVIPGTGDMHTEEAEQQSVEMICGGCTRKLEFLPYYGKLQVILKKTKQESENVDMDILTIPTKEEPSKTQSTASDSDSASQDSGIASLQGTENEISQKCAPVTSTEPHACPLKDGSSKVEFKKNGTLWVEGWRKKLCRCQTCKDKYESTRVSFLLDEEDTIENYEAVGKAKIESDMVRAEESFTRQVNDMGHVGQIELISGYNNMKEALKTFLNDFAEKGKVVGEKDVQDFFENLRATKRPRLDLHGAQF